MVHEAVRLRLVRHGEVAVPHRATFYGQRDVPLSPEGHRASLALAPRLAADAPDLEGERDGWSRNPIDRFVLARMSEAGLEPSPEMDGRSLLP